MFNVFLKYSLIAILQHTNLKLIVQCTGKISINLRFVLVKSLTIADK